MDYHLSKETEDLRNTFLISEFDRIEQLTQMPGFKEYYKSFQGDDIDSLTKKLQALYQMMEEGKIKKQDEEKVELQMICCCLAIEDEIREIILLRNELNEQKIL